MSKEKSKQSDLIATKKASQHGTSEPKFMWFPFIPYKKLVLCQGESGIGKSSFILNIATLLSRGKPMPFDISGRNSDCGDVLYLCKEDDVEEVINPRLIAMGADLDRFHIVDEPFMLDSECKRLEATINALNIRLAIIDPLTSFLGRSYNMNTAQSIGNLMRELSRVAFTTGAALVVICNMTKNAGGKEIDRHLGSSDIVNAARSVLSVTRENDDEDIITVKHLKSTLAKRAKPCYYEIVGNGIIEFINDNVNDNENYDDEPVSFSKKDIAKNMLLNMLSNGAMPQPVIKAAFENPYICGWRTVEAAKSELNIIQFYGENGISYWRLKG
jgi:RecA-family ATPase